ncbi:MAG TPA: hypothetical protein DCX80_12085 [Chloroflexi bacterium]|mgnify:CR=1 FL=1|nr:hypothetical protein [Chloroflexota bacterium]
MTVERRRIIRTCGRLGVIAPVALVLLVLLACSGPETRDDTDPTPIPTATPIPPSPTATATLAPTATATPSPTPSPTIAPASPTANASPTAVVELQSRLPALADLPDGGAGYIIAEEGTRSAQELANAYSDPAAHLQRLNTWGFKRHVYRAFARGDESGTAPTTILTTINEYGSPEQASDAVTWLKRLATTQGATESEPPKLGDEAVALTQPTAGGTPTASIYVREGAMVFVYFAQGGDPLPTITSIATAVLTR